LTTLTKSLESNFLSSTKGKRKSLKAKIGQLPGRAVYFKSGLAILTVAVVCIPDG